jgi:cation diffusion facilitator CzcD-associated flavoprotein CzcO
MSLEHFDVLIVGAGLSGIGAAYHLTKAAKGKSFAIFEGRERLGGTWDLFRYPGIRSDSDMYTLGYAFEPWREAKAIADGPSILNYVSKVAEDNAITSKIRFQHKVVRADWSSSTALWTVSAEDGVKGTITKVTCRFLLMCSGYYDYAGGHNPTFAGEEDFHGAIVHPQSWPRDLDYAGKTVVVVGSGATAVTLVPEMAKTAAKVVMLQRSPTYVVSRPAEDAFANRLRERLPARLAYGLIRWRNVLLGMFFFNQMRKKPAEAKAQLVKMVEEHLGRGYDVERHFTPRYNPWDQRLCLVPDADLFLAIKGGQAEVVTDHIDTFTPGGIRLASGAEIPADIVVKATGLKMQLMAGLEINIDGKRHRLADSLTYKGMMFSDIPNLALVSGYTNASWTLKADLISEYVCRLLQLMDKKGYVQCTPRRPKDVAEVPWFDFNSGYVLRALPDLPKQGSSTPWKLHQNYLLDLLNFRFGRLEDKVMEFRKAPSAQADATRDLEPAAPRAAA